MSRRNPHGKAPADVLRLGPAARTLGVSRDFLLRYVEAGKIRSERWNRFLVIPVAELERLAGSSLCDEEKAEQ